MANASKNRSKRRVNFGKRVLYGRDKYDDIPVHDRGGRTRFIPSGLDEYDDSDEERQFDSDFGDPSFHGKD